MNKNLIWILAITPVFFVLSGCKHQAEKMSTEKGTVFEQAVDENGETKYRYLFNQVFDDPEHKNEKAIGICYWSYETSDHVDDFQGDNVGRFCSNVQDKPARVANVNGYMIELSDLFSEAYRRAENNQNKFWGENQGSWAKKKIGCLIMDGVLGGLGALAGGVIGGAITAPTVVGVPVSAAVGASAGGVVGASVSESICEYISASTYQEYDRVASNVTLGGAEAAGYFKEARDQLATNVAKQDQNVVLNNDLSQPPLRVGANNLSARSQDAGLLMVTEFLISSIKAVDDLVSEAIRHDFVESDDISKNPNKLEGLNKSGTDRHRIRYFLTGEKGDLATPIQCPKAQDTDICRAYKAKATPN